jgi:hypothetical protein
MTTPDQLHAAEILVYAAVLRLVLANRRRRKHKEKTA